MFKCYYVVCVCVFCQVAVTGSYQPVSSTLAAVDAITKDDVVKVHVCCYAYVYSMLITSFCGSSHCLLCSHRPCDTALPWCLICSLLAVCPCCFQWQSHLCFPRQHFFCPEA